MATYIYIRGFNYKELIEVTLKVPLLLICDGNIYIYIYILYGEGESSRYVILN
jgi:hypothetical protein